MTDTPIQAESAQAGGQESVKTLALIDGANFMFRAYHAIKAMGRELNAPDGSPTGALMSFSNMVKRAKAEAGADALAIVFESTTGTFRDDIFADYKATRSETPDDVRSQMKLAKRLFPLMGVPVIWTDGFEADDLLCAYAVNAGPGWRVVMCSSDKDLGQSVGPSAAQLDPNGWRLLDEAGVLAKFGVPPAMIPQFLALQGDSVDNIPGVDRCGAKTAAKWLMDYGSIEGIYENLAKMTPKLKEGFEEARDRIPQLMLLTTARVEIELPMSPDEILHANLNPDWSAALEILRPLNMGQLIARAVKGAAAQEAKAARGSSPKP